MIEIRRSMLTLGSIICLFVLVSISYQPLVADEQIIKQESIVKIIQPIIEDDCPCERTIDICSLLEILVLILGYYIVLMDIGGFRPPIPTAIFLFLWNLGERLDCDWA